MYSDYIYLYLVVDKNTDKETIVGDMHVFLWY